MPRFGKKQEDKEIYQREKEVKQNNMLRDYIDELETCLKINRTIIISILQKVGGTIEIVDVNESEPVYIDMLRNEETKTITFSIKKVSSEEVPDNDE